MELAMANGFTELNEIEMERTDGGIVGLSIIAALGVCSVIGVTCCGYAEIAANKKEIDRINTQIDMIKSGYIK